MAGARQRRLICCRAVSLGVQIARSVRSKGGLAHDLLSCLPSINSSSSSREAHDCRSLLASSSREPTALLALSTFTTPRNHELQLATIRASAPDHHGGSSSGPCRWLRLLIQLLALPQLRHAASARPSPRLLSLSQHYRWPPLLHRPHHEALYAQEVRRHPQRAP